MKMKIANCEGCGERGWFVVLDEYRIPHVLVAVLV